MLLILRLIWSLWKRSYWFFFVIVLLDGIFAVVFTVSNLIYGGVMSLHLFMLAGAALDFLFAKYIASFMKHNGGEKK